MATLQNVLTKQLNGNHELTSEFVRKRIGAIRGDDLVVVLLLVPFVQDGHHVVLDELDDVLGLGAKTTPRCRCQGSSA